VSPSPSFSRSLREDDRPPTLPGTPTSTRVESVLMEDAVRAASVSAAPGTRPGTLAGVAALFANPHVGGKEEALVVSEAGELTYLQRDSAGDGTGWRQIPVGGEKADPVYATEVAVLVHPRDQTVWAVYSPAPSGPPRLLRLVAITDGLSAVCSWVDQSALLDFGEQPPVSGLRHMYVHYDRRTPMITGIDPVSGRCVSIGTAMTGAPRFRVSVHRLGFAAATVDDVAAGHVQGSNVVYKNAPIIYVRVGAKLLRYDARYDTQPVTVATDVADLVGVYYSFALPDLGCLYIDMAGNLVAWNTTGSTAASMSVTPGLGLVTATTWIDANEMAHVYGIGPEGDLRVLHQTSVGVGGLPEWSRTYVPDGSGRPWPGQRPAADGVGGGVVYTCVGLVPSVAAFALDPYPDTQPDQLVKRAGQVANQDLFGFYAQDVTSVRWSHEKIRLAVKEHDAGREPVVVKHYVSTVTVLDEHGMTMSYLPVRVSADTLTEIQVDGSSYLVGPGHAAALATGPGGRIVIATSAAGLLPATLHIDAAGLVNGAVVQQAAAVHDYLAGTGTLPSRLGPFTATALSQAEYQGEPVVDEEHQGMVEQTVTAVRQILGLPAGRPLTAQGPRGSEGVRPAPLHGFYIGLDPQAAAAGRAEHTYREFDTPAHAADFRDDLRRLPDYGGAWEDFVDWVGDVAQGITEGVIKVVGVFVDEVASVFIRIGGQFVELVGFVLDTIAGAVMTVEAVLAIAVTSLSALVGWLMSPFYFHDVWNTKLGLEAAFKDVVFLGRASLSQIGSITGGWFKEREDEVRAGLESLKERYAGRVPAEVGLQTQPLLDASGRAVDPGALAAGPQATWLLDQLRPTWGAAGPSRLAERSGGPQSSVLADAFQAMIDDFGRSDIADNLNQAAADAYDLINLVVDVRDPAAADKMAIGTLIDAVEKLTLAGVETMDLLWQNLLALVMKLNDNLGEVLDHKGYDSDLADTLYVWVQKKAGVEKPQQKPTLTDVVFLVCAFHITTAAKVLKGPDAEPFPKGGLPPMPVPMAPVGPAPALGWDPGANATAKYRQYIAGVSAVVGAFCDAMNDCWPLFPEGSTSGSPLDGKPTPLMALTAFGSLLCSEWLFGVMGAYPEVMGVSPDDVAYPKWLAAFYCNVVYASLGSVAFSAGLYFGSEPALKNLASVLAGPIVAVMGGVAYVVAAGLALDAANASSYARAQVAMATLPDLVQLLRFGVTPAEVWYEIDVVRTAIAAGIDFNSMVSSGGLLLGPACEADPVIDPNQVLPPAKVGVPYSYQIKASGGDQRFTEPLWGWVMVIAGTEPWPEFSLDSDSGVLSGTPAKSGILEADFRVSDSFTPPQTSGYTKLRLVIE